MRPSVYGFGDIALIGMVLASASAPHEIQQGRVPQREHLLGDQHGVLSYPTTTTSTHGATRATPTSPRWSPDWIIFMTHAVSWNLLIHGYAQHGKTSMVMI
jgi:hypothetical protein